MRANNSRVAIRGSGRGRQCSVMTKKSCVGHGVAQHRVVHARREIAEVATPLQDFATPCEWCETKLDPKT